MPKIKNYYAMDENSKRDFNGVTRRVLTQPLVKFKTPEGLVAPDKYYAKITANVGSGAYQGVQVEWNSGTWDTTDGGITWDSTTGGPGYLEHINHADDVFVDTIVEAIAWGDIDGSTVWIFTVVGASAGHPWKCRIVDDSSYAIIETAYSYPDYHDSVTVFDELSNQQNEIIATSAAGDPNPYQVDVSSVTGEDGIVYIIVEYDGSNGWVIRDETTNPLLAVGVSEFPPNEANENIDIFYIPLCRFTDQGTTDFSINQLMFVNPWFAVRKFLNPFRGRVYDTSASDQIEIGYLRDHPDYPLNDHIIVMDEEGDFEKITDDSSHISDNLTGSAGYLWYEVIQNSSDTWSLRDNGGTPIFDGGTFPPASPDMASIYILLGEYTDAGTDDFKWYQAINDNPVVSTRQFQHGFYPQYYDNAGTDSVKIDAGNVAIGDETQSVSGDTYSLGSTTYIYVEITINKQTEAISINSSLQSYAASQTEWDDDDETAIVWNIPVGVISGGKYSQKTMGGIYHPSPFMGSFQHPFQATIKAETNNILQVGYRRGDADYQFEDGFLIYDNDGDFQFVSDGSSVREITLSGSGYVWYQLYRDDSTGNWAMQLDSSNPLWSGSSFPPASPDYGVVYVLVANFSGAGTSGFTFGQLLNDNPRINPRNFLIDFQPKYTVATGTSSVEIATGRVQAQLVSQTTNAATFPLGTDTFIWVEVASGPDDTPVVTGTLQSAATFPGHATLSGGTLTTRYLIGYIASDIYYAVHTGAIFAGTLYQPDVNEDIQYSDAQGVKLLGRDTVKTAVTGEGTANSYFFEGKKWSAHFQAGQLENEDTGADVDWGGTDDDITSEQLVSKVEATTSKISVGTRDYTDELTSGLSTKNELTSEGTTDIDFTQITVVTDVQVSGTSLQKKSRTCYVLSAGAVSAWTTWHSGTTCG